MCYLYININGCSVSLFVVVLYRGMVRHTSVGVYEEVMCSVSGCFASYQIIIIIISLVYKW